MFFVCYVFFIFLLSVFHIETWEKRATTYTLIFFSNVLSYNYDWILSYKDGLLS